MGTRATTREMLRHVVVRLNGQRLLEWRRTGRPALRPHLTEDERGRVFDTIYAESMWLAGRTAGSLSGLGSDPVATGVIRKRLGDVLTMLEAQSLVDIGCGDFNWMQYALPEEFDYFGIDVAASVIERNNSRFASAAVRFQVLDAVDSAIPSGDVVLCRDVMYHLNLQDAVSLLRNASSSTARYLIATSDDQSLFNADIRTGDYRPLNLRRRPFNLPQPEMRFSDDAIVPTRYLGVWPMRTVADCVAGAAG